MLSSSATDLGSETPEYMLLPKLKFKLSLPEHKEDVETAESLLDSIKRNNMVPFYEEVCRDLGWEMDEALLESMSTSNAATWDALESTKVEENLEDRVADNWRQKLEFACSIGDANRAKEIAVAVLEDANSSTSCRAEVLFCLFRLAFCRNDVHGMRRSIEKTANVIEKGCTSGSDWCCRNKLKVYEAVYCLATRNYARAAALFLDCIPTFESHELLPFGQLVRYTILTSMIALPREDLNNKLNKHGILQQALLIECPRYRNYFTTFYDCHYAHFFENLAWIETEMRADPLLHPHYRHYVREMRIAAYSQLLQAYRSLSLERMAVEFGVSVAFIEQEVARFIASGRLHCKIDKVSGNVVTVSMAGCDRGRAPNPCCERGLVYQKTIKKGDVVLNRLKKLGRVVDF